MDSYVLRFIQPFDEPYFFEAISTYKYLVFVEDGIETGGISQYLADLVHQGYPLIKTRVLAFGDMFYPQGSRTEILSSAGLSSPHIADAVRSLRESIFVESFI